MKKLYFFLYLLYNDISANKTALTKGRSKRRTIDIAAVNSIQSSIHAQRSKWHVATNLRREEELISAIEKLKSVDNDTYVWSASGRLLKVLFNTYNREIMPPVNGSVTVLFTIALAQIIQVLDIEQKLKINVWVHTKWNDSRLIWDPMDYDNITRLQIPYGLIWSPDIILFNTADGNFEPSYKSNTIIYYTGEIVHIPPAIYQSSCRFDITFFPFDEQNCDLCFGSWTYSPNQIEFGWYNGTNKIDFAEYMKSGSWDLLSGNGRHVINNSTNRRMIIYTLRIRRKALFHLLNIVAPCIMISFCTMFVFYLPPASNEKVTLALSVLLAHIVFMLLVAKLLPPASEIIPIFAKYLLITFSANVLSVFATCIVININNRHTPLHEPLKEFGMTQKIFFQFLPTLLLMDKFRFIKKRKRRKYSRTNDISLQIVDNDNNCGSTIVQQNMSKATDYSCSIQPKMQHVLNTPIGRLIKTYDKSNIMDRWMFHTIDEDVKMDLRNTMQNSLNVLLKEQNATKDVEGRSTLGHQLRRVCTKTVHYAKCITKMLKAKNRLRIIMEQWNYLACVVDRLLLVGVFIGFCAVTAEFFMNNPTLIVDGIMKFLKKKQKN
ncbi:hypothetical protein SNEBB_005610 [Seison nebaliae]|nr:hypothetical protein SNEBB_005610 [Seison nebaliae]